MKKPKTKYSADRELTSSAFKDGKVNMLTYSTHPNTDVSIHLDLPPDVLNDLKHAIDEVLAYHKL